MATQRYISTSFWDDEWIQTLDPSEKLLYLYLMTNPLTNIAGVYKITDRRISFDTGFNLDTITHIFRKFEKAGKVYRKGEYVALPSWPKHQQWEKRSKIKDGIVAILKTLPPELLDYMVHIGYKYPIDTLSIPYTYPSNYIDSDSDIDSDIDSDTTRSVCSELPKKNGSIEAEEPPVEVIISLPILGGKEFAITKKHYNTFVEAYPGISDIMAELKKMKAWLVANPKNMKKDVLRFANNWLSRENDKKGNRPSCGRQKAIGRVSTESGSLQTSPDDYNSL
jgi:hypothetical protein